MNIIDIIILVPAVLGGIGGFRKGFILEIVSLLALILAVIGGFYFLHWGISVLTENFQLTGKFLPFLAFILIFVGIVLLVNAIGKLVKKVVHLVFLGGIDRVAGAVLGAIKFAFFFSVIVWAFQVFGVELPSKLRDDSFLYPYMAAIAPATVELFSFIIPATSDLLESISALLDFSTPGK